MARRKRKGPAAKRHLDPKEAFHLPVQLQLALECAAALADVPMTKSAVLRAELEKSLRAGGWLPLAEDNLRRLVEAVGLENLQPQAQHYLRQNGIVDA
jgi:hypothetical protein